MRNRRVYLGGTAMLLVLASVVVLARGVLLRPARGGTSAAKQLATESGDDLAALEARVAMLERRPATVLNVQKPEGQAPGTTRPPEEKPAPERVKGSAPTPEKMADVLRSERRDPAWADEYERGLKDSFGKSFPQTVLKETVCGSSVCRVQAEHGSAEEQTRFVARFWTALPAGYWGAYFQPETDDQGRQGTLLYIVRKGHEDSLVGD